MVRDQRLVKRSMVEVASTLTRQLQKVSHGETFLSVLVSKMCSMSAMSSQSRLVVPVTMEPPCSPLTSHQANITIIS